MTHYISKGTWFDAGTEATLVIDCRPDGWQMGIFLGLKDGKLDEEDCGFDEFDIIEDNACACPRPCRARVGGQPCQPGTAWTPPAAYPAADAMPGYDDQA